MNKENNITSKRLYMEKELAYAEGIYRGIFLVIPKELRRDSVDIKMVSFCLKEKYLKETLEIVQGQIKQYSSAIKGKDADLNFRKYGPIVDALQRVEGQLNKVLYKMNEPEESDEDHWGM